MGETIRKIRKEATMMRISLKSRGERRGVGEQPLTRRRVGRENPLFGENETNKLEGKKSHRDG